MVWYACYGSNLLYERFIKYIIGGRVYGSEIVNNGAKDKTLPIRNNECIIEGHELFFGYNIEVWNGSGVAFIDYEVKKNCQTYGRKYLITKEQFLDVVRQENSMPLDSKIYIDYETLYKTGTFILFEDKIYGRLLYLGDSEGYPIYTFTSIDTIERIPKGRLLGEYKEVISEGLKETYSFNDEYINRYLEKWM